MINQKLRTRQIITLYSQPVMRLNIRIIRITYS
nr:MAG TPA: hypothetical protein [Caudoviricetes sp.]